MTTIPTRISPSKSARELFNYMSARAEDGVLNMQETLRLAADRGREGRDDHAAVEELCREDWIRPSPDGGWML